MCSSLLNLALLKKTALLILNVYMQEEHFYILLSVNPKPYIDSVNAYINVICKILYEWHSFNL